MIKDIIQIKKKPVGQRGNIWKDQNRERTDINMVEENKEDERCFIVPQY